jgi:excisionase family DNA binding protein
MRSLQEWLEYVEKQAEEARKQREATDSKSVADDSDSRAPAESERESVAERAEAPNRGVSATPRVSAEGRALLSWGTTLPHVAEAETPALAEALRDDSPEEADLAPVPLRETSPSEPFQPSDPRWRSTVIPPRLRVEPVDVAALPPAISLPTDPELESALAPFSPSSERADSGDERQEEIGTVAGPQKEAPAVGATQETEKPSKRARRITRKAVSQPEPKETPEQAQVLWERVPRHVQTLIRSQNDEVAQRSYKDFRESREELVRRLLDPELSLEEAARILGVCPTTVRRYTNRNLLPHHRTPGNQRRFRLSHVLDFMEKYGKTLENGKEGEETVSSPAGDLVPSNGGQAIAEMSS